MASPGVREERTLLVGTAANVAGLLVGVAAAFGVQILLGRTLAPGGFGLVTVAVQVAFVASAGSRFGMDMASVRLVAIGRGADTSSHLRSLVDRCALVALGASLLVAALLAAFSPLFGDYARVIALAAVGVPFIALTNVYLGATRGLAQMRQTLYVFWIGQPLLWIALAASAVAAGGEADSVVLAYDASWLGAAVAAWALWRREARAFDDRPATREEVVGRSSLRTSARTRGAFRPGDLLGRSLGSRRPGAGNGRRRLRRRRASLPGAPALPHVAQPRLLAVRRRSPCARAP